MKLNILITGAGGFVGSSIARALSKHNLFLLSRSEIAEKDIEIKFVGLRPGEKLTEVLKTDDERRLATEHEKISLIIGPNKEDIERYVEELLKVSRVGNLRAILKKLKEIR